MTHLPRLAAIGLVAGALALTAAYVPAFADSPSPRMVEVPPGAVVLVIPAGAMPMSMPPSQFVADDGFADPFAMLRRVNQMMQQSFAGPSPDGMIEAAMRQMQAGGATTGVMVTTISNGRQSCTRRVTYSGDQAAPKVDVRMTGDGCAAMGTPAAVPQAPEAVPARQALPRTIQVRRSRPAPIQVAQLER